MTTSQWLQEQLRSSAGGFIEAAKQLPRDRWVTLPPRPAWLGEWSAARHIYHLLYHEQYKVLAFVQQCASLPAIDPPDGDEEAAWQRQEQTVEEMLEAFQQKRNELLALLATFDEAAWEVPREKEPWGDITLRWMAMKAYQHTCDHTSSMLQLVLFWDFVVYTDSQ